MECGGLVILVTPSSEGSREVAAALTTRSSNAANANKRGKSVSVLLPLRTLC